MTASEEGGELPDPRHGRDDDGGAGAQRARQDEQDVPRSEDRAPVEHELPPPLPARARLAEHQLLGHVRTARENAHQREAADRECRDGEGHRAGDAAHVRDAVVAERRVDEPRGHEHRGLGRGVRKRLQHAAFEGGTVRHRARGDVERERKHQEQVADLRERGVGDEKLQSFLPQRDDAREHDRGRAHAGQQLRRRERDHAGHHVEPEADDEEPRALDHERGQHRARRRRRTGVRGRQPEVQREQRGLRKEARGHQCGRRERGGIGADLRRQQRDVERAVGAVQQHGPQQVEDRAQQGEHEVPERGAQRLALPVEADQRHAGERQQLQRDVEREEVAADEHEVEGAPHGEQQQPERERRARLALAGRRAEVGARIRADAADHDRDPDQHDDRRRIGAQRDAERRRPPAQQVDDRGARAHEVVGHGERDGEPRDHRDVRDALRIAPAEHQAGEHADERGEHGQREQQPAGRRHVGCRHRARQLARWIGRHAA